MDRAIWLLPPLLLSACLLNLDGPLADATRDGPRVDLAMHDGPEVDQGVADQGLADQGAPDQSSTSGIRCAPGLFCNPATQFCCIDKTSKVGTCSAQGGEAACTASGKKPMACDDATDCGGAICCADFQPSPSLRDITCVASTAACSSPGTIEFLCDPTAPSPCPGTLKCTGTSLLGAPYHMCE